MGPSFIKHIPKDLKAQIDSNTVVVGHFHTLVSSIDRSSKQNINKEVLELNHTIDQMDLTDVYRIFHPNSEQYTFFTAAHISFSKIDHILWHKASLRIPCILPDRNTLKLKLNNKTTADNTQTIGS
jgi:exonuclease III